MQHEQIHALAQQGMSAEDIAGEMKLDVSLVRTMISSDPEDFSKEDRAMAKHVIRAIASGGDDINPRDQLKAALYIHGGKQQDSNMGISQLQKLILEAKNVHDRYRKTPVATVIDIQPAQPIARTTEH